MLRCFATEGPWTCKAKYVDRTIEDEESDAKRMGRLFHLGMEKPDTWREEVVLLPDVIPDDYGEMTPAEHKSKAETGVRGGMIAERKFKRHREFLDEIALDAKNRGKSVMSVEDLCQLGEMIEAVHANPATREFICEGQREVPIVSNHRMSGLPTRALIDIWQGDRIVDFKSTRFGTRREFVRDAYSKGYHYQMAHYCEVSGAKEAVIIAVRNFQPCESMVFRLPPLKLSAAQESNDGYMEQMAQCFALGDWHSLGWGRVNDLEYEELSADVQGMVIDGTG